MGAAYASLTLSNPRRPEIARMVVPALADTAASHLCVPLRVAEELGLEMKEARTIRLADGSVRRVPYAGPIEMHVGNRIGFGGALVMGDEVLLGAVPMEDMDLVVSPLDRAVYVNPARPDAPLARA